MWLTARRRALLAGDALNTDAFHLLSLVDPAFHGHAMRAMGELAAAAGSGGMVAGQMADIDATGAPPAGETGHPKSAAESCGGRESRLELLRYIHKHKTAALIRASLTGGALMAGVNERDLALLSSVGERVGLLFQVVDDILDVTSDYSDSRQDGRP